MGKTREEGLEHDRPRGPALAGRRSSPRLSRRTRCGNEPGQVLRIQSTQMRTTGRSAEKLAGEAPVKMLFPLIACIFLTVFMVLFGPIVFQFFFGELAGSPPPILLSITKGLQEGRELV